jgi:hypothetical protein
MHTKLTEDERLALQNASVHGPDEIDRVIAVLRREHPGAFHTAASLSARVFFDQPKQGEPCKGFVRFAMPVKLRRAA